MGWTRQSAGWLPGTSAQFTAMVLSNGTIVVFGNLDYRTNVYASSDKGVSWAQLTAAFGGAGRAAPFGVVLANGNLVVGGGQNSVGAALSDVWQSVNGGSTWTQLTANAWTSRYYPGCCVGNSLIFVLGGQGTPSPTWDDVETSPTGATWTNQNASPGWDAREAMGCVFLPTLNRVLVVCGSSTLYPTNKTDAWISTNASGSTAWTQQTANTGFSGGGFAILTQWGVWFFPYYSKSIYQSIDAGVHWTALPAAPWNLASGTVPWAVSLPDGSVVIMGVGTSRNEVWRYVSSTSYRRIIDTRFGSQILRGGPGRRTVGFLSSSSVIQ